jgi:hypothetical protein
VSELVAVLEVSRRTYEEIRAKLIAAGFRLAVQRGIGGELLDLTGIALALEIEEVSL